MTMPNFLIIGAGKSGTTSLYHYLRQHPEVYMSPVKEPKFFAVEGKELDFRGPNDDMSMNRGSVTSIEAYRDLFRGVTDEKAIGEASPLYLHSPEAPSRIKHYIPEARLIAILRDPVQRAYSSFLQRVQKGQEPLRDFAEALREEENRMRDNWAPRWYSKRIGFYYAHLRRYYDLFEGDRIRVYLNEDLKADPVCIARDVFRFLEVDDTFMPDISLRYNVSGVPRSAALQTFLSKPNPAKDVLKLFLSEKLRQRIAVSLENRNIAGPPPPLDPGVRKELVDLYREDILNLEKLIGRDLSGWLE
ncbi:MAG: sulfotransferase [Rubrobacteraceae bacterium]|nr:sulfotransferase [Rubrobacteraceae bacterium]